MTRWIDAVTESSRETELLRAVRAGDPAWRERLPAFPLKIQIQTASPCNASCVMCPWPETATTQSQGFMDEALYLDLLDQLSGRGVERTSLFLMNEPLVDRRLAAWTRLLKERVPETHASIFTNGALLDAATALALAEAGMDEVNVSVVGFDAESHERNMPGVGWERLTRNLAAVGALHRAGRLGSMSLRVVGLEYASALSGREAFEASTGLEVHLKPLTNRAGAVDVDTVSRGGVSSSARRHVELHACQRPFVKAYVLFDGRVVLCNCDWKRTTIVGDLRTTTLERVWRGPLLDAVRDAHARKRLDGHPLCAGCDYPHVR